MPRHPRAASSVADIGGSVFSALAGRLASFEGELFPLHVGDTWLEPAEGCRMQDLTVDDHPGMHRYAPPQGMAPLIDAIVERTAARTGVPTERGDVLVTAGATGALGAVMGAILEPGDEVLVLAPYWPLITGIVRCYHAQPVVVPFIGAERNNNLLHDLLPREDVWVAVMDSQPLAVALASQKTSTVGVPPARA